MTSELIVDVSSTQMSLALLEDKRLAEYQQEGLAEHFSVGNIYLARVKKIMTGLNACFVNVGYERDAFLHYLDLGEHFHTYEKLLEQAARGRKPQLNRLGQQPELDKEGSIQNTVRTGQDVLVQIVKEPISTKGPRLTCELSFAGRYLVMMPFTNKINVSSKIKKRSERARLKQLIQSLKPEGVGVIVRTVAEGQGASELDAELRQLYRRWQQAIERISQSPERPMLVYEETTRAVALLRDLFNPTFSSIYVNNEATAREIRDYVALIAPERIDIVKHYTGTLPIFDNFNVTRQIKSAFGRSVTYKHGAYLIIEHTEAMHVIDVNSGNRTVGENGGGQEANALEVNLGAADEIAHQLRLRDMGGIIIVDFIDMAEPEHRQMLYERMCQNMQLDRARHNILPLSKFGLMQITRQRVRPPQEVTVEEQCPTCQGTGTIKSSLLFTEVLEEKIDQLTHKHGVKKFRLHVHPFVAAYVNQGFISLTHKWHARYGWGWKIIPNQSLSYLEYRFYGDDGQEIYMHGEREMQ
ncbi:MAG: Rne/Rng family ribonuclease [Bacteroidaceae bacterium]|nr:Rne/Rng family ribonuclease [Bacteroidaceae bacterium]